MVAYHALFHSLMTYGIINWGTSNHVQQVFITQKRAIRTLAGISQLDSCKPWFIEYKIMTLPSCIIYSNLIYIKEHIEKYSRNGDNHNYLTRNREIIYSYHNKG